MISATGYCWLPVWVSAIAATIRNGIATRFATRSQHLATKSHQARNEIAPRFLQQHHVRALRVERWFAVLGKALRVFCARAHLANLPKIEIAENQTQRSFCVTENAAPKDRVLFAISFRTRRKRNSLHMASPGPLGASTWRCDSWAVLGCRPGCRPGCRVGGRVGVGCRVGVGWL